MGLFDNIFNKEQIVNLRKEVEGRGLELKRLLGVNEKLQSTIGILEGKIREYPRAIAEKDLIIADLTNIASKLEVDANSIERQLEVKSLEFAASLNELKSSLEEKERIVSRLEAALHDAHVAKSAIAEKLGGLQRHIEHQKLNSDRIILGLQARNDELRASLNDGVEKYNLLQCEFEDARKRFEARSRELDLRDSELSRESQRLVSDGLELQERVSNFNSREKYWKEYIEPRLKEYDSHQTLDVREKQVVDRQSALTAEVNRRREALSAKEDAARVEWQALRARQQELGRKEAELAQWANRLQVFQGRVERLDRDEEQLKKSCAKFEEQEANAQELHSQRLAHIHAEQLNLSKREAQIAQERSVLEQKVKLVEVGLKKIEREREESAELRRDSRRLLDLEIDLRAEVASLNGQLALKDKKNKNLERKCNELIGKLGGLGGDGIALLLQRPNVRSWLFQGSEPESMSVEHGYISISGEGPWEAGNFQTYLEELGYDPWSLPDEDVEYVVVGREGWSESDLLSQIDLRGVGGLKIYSQEMFVIKLMTGLDPFDDEEPDQDLFDAFADGHPALEFLRSLPQPWPEVSEDSGGIEAPPLHELAGESPLHIMGYRVGVTSPLTLSERRKVLVDCFEAKILEFSEECEDSYKRKWGKQHSAQRLYRMAYHLKYLADTVGKDARRPQAREHWAEDLKWLKQRYYGNFKRKFSWPGA
ncbi:hypothetical protein [Ramlibacter sp.]|uniref:hypothetical protein n=1 Tax=Ramlibacter sp. TaxID=1917967 RepID=UPI0035AD8501